MKWEFKQPDDIFPTPVTEESETSTIVETPYTGCAWCGDGDGNGLCSSCEAKYFPSHQESGDAQ
jgi:hypothetical protein